MNGKRISFLMMPLKLTMLELISRYVAFTVGALNHFLADSNPVPSNKGAPSQFYHISFR